MTKNIIIATQDIGFNEAFAKKAGEKEFKVLDTVVVIDFLISTLDKLSDEGHVVDGLLINTSLARNQTDGKRLELFADMVYTVRSKYPNLTFVVMSDESAGHPLLSELVGLGIYNIIERNKTAINVSDILDLFINSRTFAEASIYRNFDSKILWRNKNSGYTGAQAVITNEVSSKPMVIEKEVIVEKEKIVVEEKIVEKERIVKEQVFVEKIREIRVTPKTVVVASAYQGAGSSFVALALSRLLSDIGITNALVEHPYIQPELYGVLNGTENQPKDYIYLHEKLGTQHMVQYTDIQWTVGFSTFYPLNPNGVANKEEWLNDNTIRMLYQINEPIVIIDVSHQLHEQDIYETCLSADHIYFVVDPNLPVKFYSKVTRDNTKTLLDLEKLNKNIHIIANKDVDVNYREQWLGSLPFTPLSIVPKIRSEKIVNTIWNGGFVTDNTEISDQLMVSLYGVLKQLVPKKFNVQHMKKKGSLIGKLFRR